MTPLITAAEAACALGNDLDACVARIERGQHGLRPLSEFFRQTTEFGELLGGWIPDRRLLAGRRYGAASNVAVRVSQAACARAGWSSSDLRTAWLFVGSSRGNAGELVHAWRERRPIQRFRASNLMHSEIGAAVSIELGVRGPWQVLSNGCASGLDALGYASLAIQAGATDRALALAVDLPLVPELLAAFRATGVLSTNNVNDPYALNTSGFLPGEAAVAVTLEAASRQTGWCHVHRYTATSDAYDSIALPRDGDGMAECLRNAASACPTGSIAAICPHATGTLNHAEAELAAVQAAFSNPVPLPCLLLKPYTGHTLGASGLLDVAFLAAFASRGLILPNLPGLARGSHRLELPSTVQPMPAGGRMIKLSAGMGGHNAALVLGSCGAGPCGT